MNETVRIGPTHEGITRYGFQCPGCEETHWLDSTWEWNGDLKRPTFKPSILVTRRHEGLRCHSYIRDGRIEFLSDCSHAMAGKTVQLGPVDA